MTTLAFLQVVLRQFFSTGILWADILLRHLVLWIGLLGAALATAAGKNFAWEAQFFEKGRLGAAKRLLAHAAAAFVAAWLCQAAWVFWAEDKAGGDILFSIGSWKAPSWVFSFILPLGFALVLFHTLIKLAAAALQLAQGEAK